MFFIEKKGKITDANQKWIKVESFSLEENEEEKYLCDLELTSGFIVSSDTISLRLYYKRINGYRNLWTNYKFLEQDVCKFEIPIVDEKEEFTIEIKVQRALQYIEDPCEIDFHLYIRSFS